MPDDFEYDVFLSHNSKDKAVVRPVAEHLRKDGLRVWFDEWEIKAGDSIPAKVEEGLEHSRVLALCISVNAFGSDWAKLEAGTYGKGSLPFRDPLSKERRLIPLQLGLSESEHGELSCPRTQGWVRRQTGSARCCRAETILNWAQPSRQLLDCLGSKWPTDSP